MANPSQPGLSKQDWAPAADKAKAAVASATDAASQAASSVGNMASQAVSDVGKRADELTSNAGAGIKGWGDTLAKNTPHDGMVGTASQAVAKVVKDSGEYVQDAKLSGMMEDLVHLIRKNPIPTIALAVGLGWIIARNLKD